MPLLPALPIFHSSSSSKFPKLSLVTRSSTGPSLESTPPATCQPTGNPGSFQPRQSGAPSSCKRERQGAEGDRKSTRLNSSHSQISYAVFCLKKKKNNQRQQAHCDPRHAH